MNYKFDEIVINDVPIKTAISCEDVDNVTELYSVKSLFVSMGYCEGYYGGAVHHGHSHGYVWEPGQHGENEVYIEGQNNGYFLDSIGVKNLMEYIINTDRKLKEKSRNSAADLLRKFEVIVNQKPSHVNPVQTVKSVDSHDDVTGQFDLIKLYVKLGILRLEDTDALLVRAMSNVITNEERDVLRQIYVGEIQ